MTDLSGSDLAAAMIAEAQGGGKKPSKLHLPTIAAIAILTLVAVAGGTGVGIMLAARQPAAPPAEAAHAPEAEAEAHATANATPAKGEKAPLLVPLKQTITTLASPPRTLVRLDAAVLVKPGEDADIELLAAQVQADTLAFLRTVDLVQIEGARGLTHLREDLRERARIRSPAVADYLVQSLVVE